MKAIKSENSNSDSTCYICCEIDSSYSYVKGSQYTVTFEQPKMNWDNTTHTYCFRIQSYIILSTFP